MRNRALVEYLEDLFPDMNFSTRDVKNARARARKAQLGTLTHTQAMFRFLDEEESTKYVVKWKNNDANSGAIEGIYITHSFGDKMMKYYPYTVLFDNTYKTNKFGFAFFQVVVMTPFGNAASVACGLINSELQIGFDWLLQQYQNHRARVTDQPLLVVTTDSDTAMRNAIRACYPDVSLQLCKFHLNKNVALHISRKWKSRHDTQNQGMSQDQEEGGGSREPIQQQDSGQVDLDDTISQDSLTTEYVGRVRDLNKMILSLETGGQPTLPTLNSTVEYSKAGVWELWVVILTRSTEEEFLEAWESMIMAFHDQRELMRYFTTQIWPVREQWALCHTRENLNFGQTTTSPVESINKLLKSFVVTANTSLDVLIMQYLRMVQHMEDKYEEQLRLNATFSDRIFVDKPEFSQVKRKIAEKALTLANHQLLKLQRFVRGDPNVNLVSSITRNQGIISAKALHDRHKSETPVLLVEDFNPFWWLTRKDDDLDRYRSIHDPEKVDSLKGRPRNTARFRSDLAAPRLRVVRLPPSSTPAAVTGIQPSARRTPSSWETDDVLEITSRTLPAASTAATRGRKRAAPSTNTRAAKTRVASLTVSNPDLVDLTGDFD